MGKLELSLLGTPQVRHAGQVLTFPTRKVLALLIYLVVEDGLHSRDQMKDGPGLPFVVLWQCCARNWTKPLLCII